MCGLPSCRLVSAVICACGMPQQQLDQLQGRVAGRAEDGDACGHRDNIYLGELKPRGRGKWEGRANAVRSTAAKGSSRRMPVYTIETLDDPRLEPYRQPQGHQSHPLVRSFRGRGGKAHACGCWHSSCRVLSVLVDRTHLERLRPHLRDELDVLVVADRLVPQIVGFNFHRGVLACGRRPDNVPLDKSQPIGETPAAAGRTARRAGPGEPGHDYSHQRRLWHRRRAAGARLCRSLLPPRAADFDGGRLASAAAAIDHC